LCLHIFINSVYFLLEILEADLDLANADCIVTVSFGVYFVLWLFELVL
jgi:hypothetical protein